MKELLEKLSVCVEFGKIDIKSPYPPAMKDKEGAFELTKSALDAGISPSEILEEALIPAMSRVGQKFSRNEIFVPQMLMAAKAMSSSMIHLKPYYLNGQAKRRGTFIIGTVTGDLHDIGKNLVAMMIEGAGWEVIDLGVDVNADKFIQAAEKHPGCGNRIISPADDHHGEHAQNGSCPERKASGTEDPYWRGTGHCRVLYKNWCRFLLS